MNTSDKISLAAMIVSFVLGVLALWQTRLEMKLSNKQHLLEKRVHLYNQLIRAQNIHTQTKRLYDELVSNEKDSAMYFYDESFMLFWLTDNVDLYEVDWVNWRNDLSRCQALKKLEELEDAAQQMGLLFEGKQAIIAQKYISQFGEVIKAVRACCISHREREEKRKRMSYAPIKNHDECLPGLIKRAQAEWEIFHNLGRQLDTDVLRKQLEIFPKHKCKIQSL